MIFLILSLSLSLSESLFLFLILLFHCIRDCISVEMNNVSIYLIADCLHYFDSSFEKYFFLPENLDYSELEDPSILFIPESASSHLSECEHFFEVYNSVGDYLRLVMCIIVVLGLLLNLFVLLVLVVDNTKTSSDVYLMSISLGDISICLGVLFSQRQFFSDSFTAVLGKIFGSLGKPRMQKRRACSIYVSVGRELLGC